jgi:hypothetical protein
MPEGVLPPKTDKPRKPRETYGTREWGDLASTEGPKGRTLKLEWMKGEK